MDLYEKVLKIIIEQTECEELKNDFDIDLIENDIIDSLAFINIINSLNDEFNIEIQPTEVSPDSWKTVKSITDLVSSLL